MTFRNRNDLLVWLVSIADSDRNSCLSNDSELLHAAVGEGLIEAAPHDYAEFGRMLFALKDEGSIEFIDYAGMSPGQTRPSSAFVDYNDVVQAARIEITGAGRIASSISRPNISIGQLAFGNIANVDMAVVVPELEQRIDASNEPEETKEEAKSRLRPLADTAADVGTGAAGDLLASVLRQYGGLP